jgi:uncharacterized protein (TIGR03066 family)
MMQKFLFVDFLFRLNPKLDVPALWLGKPLTQSARRCVVETRAIRPERAFGGGKDSCCAYAGMTVSFLVIWHGQPRKGILMKLVGAVALGLTFILATAGKTEATDGEKKGATNAAKLLGKWEATTGEIPTGAVLEFTKDGNVTLTLDLKGTLVPIAWSGLQGTYKIEGEKLKTVRKVGEMEVTDTFTIKTLTASTFVLEDNKKKVEAFKRTR